MKNLSNFNLQGQKTLIVGGASGIGRATAELFAEAGADVAIADINLENAQQTASSISANGSSFDAFALEVNVINKQSVEDMVHCALDQFSRIDVLVNSAGINCRIPTADLKLSDWDDVIDINLKGTFLCCQYVGRQMITQQHGKIINLASMSSLVTNKSNANIAYCSSKGGVVMLTKSLAVEWAKHNINVNALAPGYVITPFNREWMENPHENKMVLDAIPMGRFGDTIEIASSALFLASKASNYITGTILQVDGGYACH